jgi:hypothetical protein
VRGHGDPLLGGFDHRFVAITAMSTPVPVVMAWLDLGAHSRDE